MPTYEELNRLDLSGLEAAVEDWARVRNDLAALADQAEGGLLARAREAAWSGENAGVTRRFVETVAERFGYARDEAAIVHRTLEDLLDSQRDCRRRLRALSEDAAEGGLYIQPDGRVVVPSPDPYRPQGEATAEQAEFSLALTGRIAEILSESQESDAQAAQVLRDLADDGHGPFRAAPLRAEAIEDAQEILPLLRRGGELTDEEIATLNDLLARRAGNVDFAAYLATELGARGTLDFWSELTHERALRPRDAEEWQLLAELQANLGTALGTATHSDAAAMDAWEEQMIDLGDEMLGANQDYPMGYQVMGSLMHSGAYDTEFLTAYGDSLLDYERGTDGFDPRQWGDSGYGLSRLSFGSEDDPGFDPMSGFMEALGRNPEASNQVLYRVDNFDYLVQQRTWPTFFTGDGVTLNGAESGYTALGHALESATLGHPYDDDTPLHSRTVREAALAERIVDYYGSNPEAIGHGDLTNSLARISAGYMADIERSFLDSAVLVSPEQPASFDYGKSAVLLSVMGRDPEAYGTLLQAQESYTALAVDNVINAHDYDTAETLEAVQQVSQGGGMVSGILSEARAYAVFDQSAAQDAEFNQRVQTGASWAETLLGYGVDRTVGNVPVAGTIGNWAVSGLVNAMGENLMHDNSAEAAAMSDEIYARSMDRAQEVAAAATRAAVASGATDVDADVLAGAAASGAAEGHDQRARLFVREG
ncbi:DUF6571 family protein [Streptomyces hoynatensis]|uniref:Uncharacterized protein n=1 Tax=Streptomyces hoynatensis TaxID=1141874 RepID=A0A3A9YXZ9_9ACTN|nr:DUF6571 family protein [Streptomyces hoynatensis]RKN40106.1 hypothetical protein D7294_19565 [Streptomyces hoynatensis]